MGLADIHMHTIYSYDGTATVPSVLAQARSIRLDVIAITDHDEIRGALQALDLATKYDIDVIPGVEITTADGDLLALNVTDKIPRGLPVGETLLRVEQAGGVAVAPHPMAGGMGMKSLGWYSIWKAAHDPQTAKTLVAIETYNATALDTFSNEYSAVLANSLGLPKTGSSDAHVLEAIGLGATEFRGHSAADLLAALRNKQTQVVRGPHWDTKKVLGSWLVHYIGSFGARLAMVTQ